MADRHRNPVVTFRPPPEDKEWLTAYAEATSRDISAIMTDALADLRRRVTRRAAVSPAPQHLDSP
jgi:predicted transcriptional regulator